MEGDWSQPPPKRGVGPIPNLVITKGHVLEVYIVRVQEDDKRLNADASGTTPKRGGTMAGLSGAWLEVACHYRLHGNVESMAILSPGRDDGRRKRDAIILSFRDAKVSVLEFDDSIHGLRTSSMHYFEGPDWQHLKRGREKFARGPLVQADPQGRCGGVLLYDSQMIILKAAQNLPHDAYRLLAVPSPVGGVLVVCANSIHYHSQQCFLRTVQRLELSKSRASILASCISTVGDAFFFLGSRLGDSLLVQFNCGVISSSSSLKPVKDEEEDEFHAYLIISLESRIMVLETGDMLGEMTESVDYYVDGCTISAGNLFGRRHVVQVYARGVRIFDGAYMTQELCIEVPNPDSSANPESAVVSSVSIADPYVLLKMTDGSIQLVVGDTQAIPKEHSEATSEGVKLEDGQKMKVTEICMQKWAGQFGRPFLFAILGDGTMLCYHAYFYEGQDSTAKMEGSAGDNTVSSISISRLRNLRFVRVFLESLTREESGATVQGQRIVNFRNIGGYHGGFLAGTRPAWFMVCRERLRVHPQIFYYAPKSMESWKGQKLLPRAEFHVGAHVTKFLRLQMLPTTLSDRTNRFALLFGSLDGSIGCIAPLDELTFRRLQTLQRRLVDAVPHVGGLNPRAFRQFCTNGKAHRPGPENIVDCELLC